MTDPIDESQKQNRIAMIRQAMKDKAPQLYQEVESSGRLQEFLEAHDAEMMASYQEAVKKAWEETWDRYMTFADDSFNESSSPMG